MSHFVYFLPFWTGLISIQLFSVYHVHIQCLILINEWTNLEFCTSFAIRQQWLPPGITNWMVFNFKLLHDSIGHCQQGIVNLTFNMPYILYSSAFLLALLSTNLMYKFTISWHDMTLVNEWSPHWLCGLWHCQS